MRSSVLAYEAWSRQNPPNAIKSLHNIDDATDLLQSYFHLSSIVGPLAWIRNRFDSDPQLVWLFGLSSPGSTSRASHGEVPGHGSILVHHSSPLFEDARKETTGDTSASLHACIQMTPRRANQMVQRYLVEWLNGILGALDKGAVSCMAFKPPCTIFTLYQNCGSSMPAHNHILLKDMNISAYNKRVRLHLLLIGSLNRYTPTPWTRNNSSSGRGRAAMQGYVHTGWYLSKAVRLPVAQYLARKVLQSLPSFTSTTGHDR